MIKLGNNYLQEWYLFFVKKRGRASGGVIPRTMIYFTCLIIASNSALDSPSVLLTKASRNLLITKMKKNILMYTLLTRFFVEIAPHLKADAQIFFL